MGWLDRVAASVSPEWALRREKARVKLGNFQRARAFYDGATRGRRFDSWRTPQVGPNSEVRGNIALLRNRSRDLVRNNPWAAKACSAIPDDAVGYGITFTITHKNKTLEKRLQELAKGHLETTAIDADGRHDIYGLQWLAMRTIVEAGESMARRRFRRPSDNLPLPFQVQLMEPDHLDTQKEGSTDANGRVVQGVEMLPTGRRVAYWLYQDHPGEQLISTRSDSRRIPAEDILHVYRMDRPGQMRGIPWGAPCIVTLKDFQDYQDNQLVRQKLAASYGPIEIDPDGEVPKEGVDHPITEAMEPGMFTRATPGFEVLFPSVPSLEGYLDHSHIELRKVAAGYGIPYEVLTGDLTNTNFASGRLGRLPYFRAIDAWLWRMLIPLFCDPIGRWFLESAELLIPGALQATFTWTPPKREMQDPTKEVPAKRDEIAAGLISYDEALRERGLDPVKAREEIKAGLKFLRDDLQLPAYGATAPVGTIPDEPDLTPKQQARALGLVG
jgi:lambda family phage portal protein